MRALKKFHIWDFPDSMYVLLDSPANELFFKKMYKQFESRRQYSKFLKLDPSTIKEYDNSTSTKNRKIYVQYIPIWVLKKSKQFLNVNEIKIIARGVQAYRSRAGKPIKNHILPVQECPALYRLLGHMIGDGSATKCKRIVFCGKEELMSWLRGYMAEHADTNPDLKLKLHQSKSIYYLSFGRVHQARKVAKVMYENATIWMKRKRDRIDSWETISRSEQTKKGWITRKKNASGD